MITVEKLKLENFRNLSNQIISLGPNVNCIFGLNGNGKTNILEALFLTINKKSFRKKASFQQILSIDCEKPVILSSITIKNQFNDVDYYSVTWENNKFSCIKNNEIKTRKPELNCIFISPFDSFSFHHENSFRRNLLDSLISSTNTLYKKNLSDYNKLLKQKNNVLKFSRDALQLDAIDQVLSSKVEFIESIRFNFISDLKPYLERIYQDIFCENVVLRANLKSEFFNLERSEIFKKLVSNRKADIINGFSKNGPHRDEFNLLFNGFDSVDFCSLGQQKTAYLSLLFAYINLFRYKFRVFPIVLIDDVSGELDSIRLELLIKYLFNADYQVVLTTANEEFKNNLNVFGNINIVNVKDGYFH